MERSRRSRRDPSGTVTDTSHGPLATRSDRASLRIGLIAFPHLFLAAMGALGEEPSPCPRTPDPAETERLA